MFGPPLRLARGARAGGHVRDRGPRGSRGFAIGAEPFWLALLASLFVAWAVSPSANQADRWAGAAPGCLFGKGGVVCNGAAETAGRQAAGESAEAPCVSFGTGGRNRKPRPWLESRPQATVSSWPPQSRPSSRRFFTQFCLKSAHSAHAVNDL